VSLAQAAPEPHAGRMCPVDYHYPPAVFDRPPDIAGDTLYVAGGLYGNLQALDAIERLAGAESTPPTIVFNGDFHWFDAEPAWFAEVERRVTPYPALRGNVETEIARTADIGAGCGCAYPPDVDEDVVRRSNDILRELHAQTLAAARARLARLPMHLVAQVGALRVGIVHGDATSLAGWRFASDNLGPATDLGWLDDVRRASQIDLFASTHTGLAVLRDFALPAGRLTIINNGAAGMPNFTGSRFGVVSRVATTRSPHPGLYGLVRDSVHIDALAVDYDHAAFLQRFLTRWPDGTGAHQSYFWRIASGPDYLLACARG